jgi:pimeloyl-ACP methyl ester carboxylesterase
LEQDAEFSLLAETAREVGVEWTGPPKVTRRWVQVPVINHVSALTWGKPAEVAFLHGEGDEAHVWDGVVLALGRPVAALDLGGHGHSSWRANGQYAPKSVAPGIVDALRSLAPKAQAVVGSGLGALTAVAVAAARPQLVRRLVLIDTLPGTAVDVPAPVPDGFATPDQAASAARFRRPDLAPAVLRRLVATNLAQREDGRWVWRHHAGQQELPPSTVDPEVLWADLARVSGPVLVVRATTASRISDADVDQLERRAPQAEVVTIAASGRDLPIGSAAELARLIDSFLTVTSYRQESNP